MDFENNNNNTMKDSKVPFEVALDKVGFGLYSWLLTALAGCSIIGYACIVYAGTIVVRTSACDLQTTNSQRGFIMAAPILALILGAIMWGYLADTRGRRSMALAAFFSAIVFNTIASFSVNWIMLLIFQFIAAFMASGQYSIMMSLLSECVPLSRRNLVVLGVASIFMLSQGLMSLMTLPINHEDVPLPALNINWSPWRTTLVIFGIPNAICFIWMFFMQESPKYAFLQKGEEESLEILKRMHRINHRGTKEELQVKGLLPENSTGSSDPNSKKLLIKELFKGKLLKYLIIMTTLAVFQQASAFQIWLVTIADQFVKTLETGEGADLNLCKLLLSAQNSSEVFECTFSSTSVFFIFGVVVLQSLVNGILVVVVGKLGRRNMVMVVAATCGVSGIIVNLIPNAIASVIFFVIFLMAVLLIGLYTAITLALFPTHLRALAVSLTMAGGRIMLSIVTVILSFLLERNCALGFYIFASVVAASAFVVSFLPDDRFLNQPKQIQENPESPEVTT